MDALRREIQVSELPVSYREALVVAKELGLRYLWIDSLCICQDSEADWLHEAAMMDKVYEHSKLNIAMAGAAQNSEPSFTARSEAIIRPVLVEPSAASGNMSHSYYLVLQDYKKDVSESKLWGRAWVYQEIWLAPKILFLSNEQLTYRCKEGLASETFPGWEPDALRGKRKSRNDQDPEMTASGLTHADWDNVVERYSQCELTYASDKIIAISGVAKVFQRSLQDEYVAGYWRSQMPAQLVWDATGDTCSRPIEYKAPSWSWASVESPINFSLDSKDEKSRAESGIRTVCNVEDITITLKDATNKTGPIIGGLLTLRGSLHLVLPHDGDDGVELLLTAVHRFTTWPVRAPSASLGSD
ncbi:hypothetical protein LTS10_009858 [Elasticomyces elasticus]|nr:hypothetical protein LTS10_009858 [Elasticomyces elasticus]